MKTKIQYFAALLAMIMISVGPAVSQEASTDTNQDPQEVTINNIKEFNAFVKTLNWNVVTQAEKVWLEEKYNELVEQMERMYHGTPSSDIVMNEDVPVYSYTDLRAAVENRSHETTRFLFKHD